MGIEAIVFRFSDDWGNRKRTIRLETQDSTAEEFKVEFLTLTEYAVPSARMVKRIVKVPFINGFFLITR